jgi:CBS domain-containing protein
MAKSVRDVMTANPVSLPADAPIREAARNMRDNDVGVVVAEKGGTLHGLVTDRDIVVRAVAEGKNAETTDLESICSKDVTALSPSKARKTLYG